MSGQGVLDLFGPVPGRGLEPATAPIPLEAPALVRVEPADARPDVVLVCPHPAAPVDPIRAFYACDPDTQREVEARVLDWTDAGALEATTACAEALPALALRPALSRAAVDLNRSWDASVDPAAAETLLGKPALDAWSRDHLAAGAADALRIWHRRALAELRAAAAAPGVRALVEIHSYGALGSTYDRLAGGRPVRRPPSAIVRGGPWKTAYPSGLSRLLPACLDGTPWHVEAALAPELAAAGFPPGPDPYPAALKGSPPPWSVSSRFLAERWFRWLGRAGLLSGGAAERLADLAWEGEHADPIVALDEADRPAAADLAALLAAWTPEGSALADRFHAEDGSFTAIVEMRDDLVPRAPDLGRAVATGLRLLLRG